MGTFLIEAVDVKNFVGSSDVVIGTALDSEASYLPPLLVLITSLGANGRVQGVPVLVLTLGVESSVEKAISKCGERSKMDVALVRCPPANHLPTLWCGTPVVYLPLQLPNLCEGSRRILYLDADTLVRAPIDDLKETSLSGRPIGAVYDRGIDKLGIRLAECAGDPALEAEPYFNAGVMVLDVDAWFAHGMTGRLEIVLNQCSERLKYHPQDALNVAAVNRWTALPRAWNVPAVFGREFGSQIGRHFLAKRGATKEDIQRMKDSAKIIHFLGPFKPWKKHRAGSGSYEKLFWSYFPNQLLEASRSPSAGNGHLLD